MNQPDYVQAYPNTSPYSSAGSHAPPIEHPSTPNPLAPWVLGLAVLPPLVIIVLSLLWGAVGFLSSMLTIFTGWCAVGLGIVALILGSGRSPEHRRTGITVSGMIIGFCWSCIAPFVPMAMMVVMGLNP
ncbi:MULTISPECIES: hypothetical protein [unclassified Corynebacterium]|uniref:hypothetical protein n=1 Tax=unclassified Corynebacterium TaxID=2624378 RepID=UPI000AA1F2B0|nr:MULTISPECIES: hypothetical protein [unclassified Corynebacterium]